MENVQLGNVGTVFELTIQENGVAVDVSSATTKQLKFGKPNGTSVTKTAAFTATGTDGKIRYTTIANDLDVAGWWSVQAYLVITGFTGHSTVEKFLVSSNL